MLRVSLRENALTDSKNIWNNYFSKNEELFLGWIRAVRKNIKEAYKIKLNENRRDKDILQAVGHDFCNIIHNIILKYAGVFMFREKYTKEETRKLEQAYLERDIVYRQ